MGRNGVVTSGHYLATAAGFRVLERGGNALDAGAAAGFALAVVEPHLNGIAGEVPILVYPAREDRVYAISGQGWAPRAMTLDWFREHRVSLIPGDGLLAATVPAAVDAWILCLIRFGRLTLAETLGPAIELAEEGFPMYPGLRNAIRANADRFRREWPGSAAVCLPGGRVPEVGEAYRQLDWARTFRRLIEAESAHSHRGREAALRAARDEFYRGDIARRIADFAQGTEVLDETGVSHRGFLSADDLVSYEGAVEEPVCTAYRGLEVFKCGPWSQGPVLLQMLNLLEGFDLSGMGHNSADYIHTWIEAAKLAFADREAYYGDPRFSPIPLERLLDKGYAAERRSLIDPARASLEMRPGDAQSVLTRRPSSGHGRGFASDTTHLDVIDSEGNLLAATPSGAWISASPVIPGLGFPLGTRGQMFLLEPGHPNALEPGKRPRTTLTPSLVLREGRPFMVFGTPGGDNQDQWTCQFFLNFVDFGMNVQAALDAPTFHSLHFPGSFYPRTSEPGHVAVEARIPEGVRRELENRGHVVRISPDWSHGRCLAIWRDDRTGTIFGGASPRLGTGYAMGR
ncbi:MAG: gamma-glutamyltransferase family protein [Planctomycetes bacterium]|nr:gamma-glutamyltransferase family protein [Planctomycetota bacterium]